MKTAKKVSPKVSDTAATMIAVAKLACESKGFKGLKVVGVGGKVEKSLRHCYAASFDSTANAKSFMKKAEKLAVGKSIVRLEFIDFHHTIEIEVHKTK